MKEYIDKQGFKNYIADGLDSMMDVLVAKGKHKIAIEVTRSFLKDIDEQSTVTKADICREFAEKVKDTLYFCDDLQEEYGITSESGFKILDLIDKVLAEMEQGE